MATLTSILGTALISNAPSVLNGNFDALNSTKVESSVGSLLAPIINSPSIRGFATASTVSAGTNNEQIATTRFVNTALAGTLPTLITTSPYAGTLNATTFSLPSSVLSYLGLFNIPIGMSVNQVSLQITSVLVQGGVRMGIYNTTGQTQVASMLFSSIVNLGMKTVNVASVALNAGSYYYAVTPVDGNIIVRSVAPDNNENMTGSVVGKMRYSSSVVATGGLLPTNFSPSAMGINTANFINIRFDN